MGGPFDIKGLISWFKSKNFFPVGNIFARHDGRPVFNNPVGHAAKLRLALQNPALLKVICLQCDLFSLGTIYAYANGVERKRDRAIKMLKRPNVMQTQKQWLWDFMFWNMLGVNVIYNETNILNADNNIYFLSPDKIQWPRELEAYKDKLILSNKTLDAIRAMNIKYKYEDGTVANIPIGSLDIITDLSNGVGNWFSGNSRIDALYKIISNADETLDAKNINTRYTGKFIVAGKNDVNDIRKQPMGEDEKESVETEMNGVRKVYAMKSMVDIKRFVDDMRGMVFDEAYAADYYLIGNMYNIPRDILEAYLKQGGATFENKEKSMGQHIVYTMQPKGDDLMAAISARYYKDNATDLVISWDDLPCMAVFKQQQYNMQATQFNNFRNAVNAGISIDEANAFADTNFTSITKPTPPNNGKAQG